MRRTAISAFIFVGLTAAILIAQPDAATSKVESRDVKALSAAPVNIAQAPSAQGPQPSWYKGNTHAHTLNSDGDSTPDEVVRWYRQHGYDFLFITDHDMVTDVDPLNALFGGGGQFLVMRGEEVTSNYKDLNLRVHVNALNPTGKIDARKGTNARETLHQDLDAVRAVRAIAQINHPNFFWQLTANDIAAVKGARLLEIANMHPVVNSFASGPGVASAEEIWDEVLSRGVTIWGVASDDEHELKENLHGDPADPSHGAVPGRGWIVVRSKSLSADEIIKAIEAGDFYASTGVELQDYGVAEKQIVVSIRGNDRFQTRYRVQFIGKNGRVLQDSIGTMVRYAIKRDEGYVRARITDSNDKMAWTQPVFVQ